MAERAGASEPVVNAHGREFSAGRYAQGLHRKAVEPDKAASANEME